MSLRHGLMLMILAMAPAIAEDNVAQVIRKFEEQISAANDAHAAKVKSLKKDAVLKLQAEVKAAANAGNLAAVERAMTKIKELSGDLSPAVNPQNSEAIKKPDGPATAKLIVWNNTDGQGDHGANQVKIELIKAAAVYWTKTMDVVWKEGEESKTEVDVPALIPDQVKVSVLKPHKADAGLAELELYIDGQNILKGKQVKASSEWDTTGKSTEASKITDGDRMGGWRARGRVGWVQIEIGPNNAASNQSIQDDRLMTTKFPKAKFEDGERLYSNRDYVVADVPAKYKGWTIIRLPIKTGEAVSIKLNFPLTVLYIPYGKSGSPPAGFTDTSEMITIVEGETKAKCLIYSKEVSGVLNLPPSEGYGLIVQTQK